MFLKFRYRLGYESLCAEVSDSITWRRFCRIPIDGRVPHPTTADEGDDAVRHRGGRRCNEALLATAAETRLLRTTRLRADPAVIPADVAYPTDSGLLARAVRRIAATGRRVPATGGATRTRVRERNRSAGARAHAIGAKLRLRSAAGREEAQRTVARITGELADLAERAAADADRLLTNARRAVRHSQARAEQQGRRTTSPPCWRPLDGSLPKGRQRLAGTIPDGATRRVSLHDGDARPIAKGRLGKPVEFGCKAQALDNDDGVVARPRPAAGQPAGCAAARPRS